VSTMYCDRKCQRSPDTAPRLGVDLGLGVALGLGVGLGLGFGPRNRTGRARSTADVSRTLYVRDASDLLACPGAKEARQRQLGRWISRGAVTLLSLDGACKQIRRIARRLPFTFSTSLSMPSRLFVLPWHAFGGMTAIWASSSGGR